MPQGIKLPSQVKNGRLVLISGDEYIQQLVINALGDRDCDNPFVLDGIDESMIFQLNTAELQAQLRRRIEAIFEVLDAEQLARLANLTFESKGPDLIANIEYTNLETGIRTAFFAPASGGEIL